MIALYTVLRRGGVNSSLQKMHPLDAEGNKNMGWERGEQGKRAVHKQGLQRAWASINQLRKEREEFAYPPASVRAGARGGGYWIFSQESQHRWEREWGGFPERKGEAVSWMEWIEQGWRKRKKVSKVGVSEENEEWKVFLKKESVMQWSRIQMNKYVMSCHAHKDFLFNTKVVPIDGMLNKGSAFQVALCFGKSQCKFPNSNCVLICIHIHYTLFSNGSLSLKVVSVTTQKTYLWLMFCVLPTQHSGEIPWITLWHQQHFPVSISVCSCRVSRMCKCFDSRWIHWERWYVAKDIEIRKPLSFVFKCTKLVYILQSKHVKEITDLETLENIE